MGEIRSTLDIIMEKTKNLSLSPEEKKQIRQQEWLGKARGWVQKYLDEVIGLDELRRGIGSPENSEGMADVLREGIIAAVDPGKDQQRRWEVLAALWGTHRERLDEILDECRSSLSRLETQAAGRMLEQLAGRGVSGSAVVPNLNQDPEWASFRAGAVRECVARLQQIR